MSTSLQRNFRFMSLAVIGVAAVQFVLYLLIARYLGSEDYGGFAIALTMALLAAPLCDLGMKVSVIWNHARSPDRLAEFIGASLVARLALALPVGCLAVAAGHGLGLGAEVLWLFVPLFAAALFDGVAGLFSGVFQAKEAMGWSSAILLGRNVARVAGLGTTLLVGGDLWTLAISWVVASSASAALAGGLLLRQQPVRYRRGTVGPVLREAWPFGSAIIANLLLLQSDILMLGFFAGDGEVGLYHAAFRFVVLAELLPHVISVVIIPRSFRIGQHEGAAKLSRFYRVQTLVLGTAGLVGSVALALHGEAIATLALGRAYAGSGVLLTALAPMVFLRFVLVPLGDALSSLGFQHRLSRAVWIALVLNVGLNLWLIPQHGALGAVLATCCSQVGMLLVQMAFAAGTGLVPRWHLLLAPPALAAGVAAAGFTLLPVAAAFLLPAMVTVLLVGLWLMPSDELRSVLRVSRSSLRDLRPR